MINESKIIYEDENFLVLDKPSGLVVNRSETTRDQETLQDWVEKKLKIPVKTAGSIEEDYYKRSGIVHRLDKDTSGIILVAKNPQTFQNLQKQFKEHQVKKVYLALVWGKLQEDGSINVPISRNPYNRLRFGVFLGGKEAKTTYYILKNTKIDHFDFSLLKVTPETGRTHQIRVHLNYLKHPIVGDLLYSGRKLGKEGLRLFGRLMLHAYKISFLNPKNNKRSEFVSEIPEEFTQIIKNGKIKDKA